MVRQKYKKLYPGVRVNKIRKGICPAPMLSFFKKNNEEEKWHANCILKSKSDTLISFLLKKVYFVPQSWPFSFIAPGICPSLAPGDH